MKWWQNTALKDYDERLHELKVAALMSGLTEEEINCTLQESLLYIRKRKKKSKEIGKRIQSKRIVLFLVIVGCTALAYYSNVHKNVHNLVERNIQGVIYPFMKLYRQVTLPLIAYFPRLTALYDESCLIENPYFLMTDMECWPCESARVVLNLTESISKAHIGLPFILKSTQSVVKFPDLRQEYLSHSTLIDENAGAVTSNVGLRKTEQLFGLSDLPSPNAHVSWRINRMEVGRALRSLLQPPSAGEIPPHASAMGIERFLLIDGPSASVYPLPSTEAANVFIRQLCGQRLIVLDPTPECRGSCRKLSVLLESQHILWYNWWYWRPRSHPVLNNTMTSITFIGSSA